MLCNAKDCYKTAYYVVVNPNRSLDQQADNPLYLCCLRHAKRLYAEDVLLYDQPGQYVTIYRVEKIQESPERPWHPYDSEC